MPIRAHASVKIKDVARKSGVSVATISRVLNHAEVVAPETVELVWKTIRELNYIPDNSARSLRVGKTNTLGLLVDQIGTDYYFTPLLSGIEAFTSQAGYALLIFTSGHLGPRKNLPTSLGLQNTDGILIFSGSLEDSELVTCHQMNLPMVLIHQSTPDSLSIPCVTVENKKAAHDLVEHLIKVHGRRRIAFMLGPEKQEDAAWRELGYREALAANGIPFDSQLVARGDFMREVTAASIQEMARAGIEFDAVFAGDDNAAEGALEAVRELGKRVPEDVSVVGFDDQRLVAYLNPPLTTVRVPTRDVGYEAARQLMNLIQNGKADPLTLLPTELVIRRSCGCGGQESPIYGLRR